MRWNEIIMKIPAVAIICILSEFMIFFSFLLSIFFMQLNRKRLWRRKPRSASWKPESQTWVHTFYFHFESKLIEGSQTQMREKKKIRLCIKEWRGWKCSENPNHWVIWWDGHSAPCTRQVPLFPNFATRKTDPNEIIRVKVRLVGLDLQNKAY